MLNTVTVPNSVTSIGKEAFAHCENLKTITLPDSITRMGNYAFIDTAWYENQPEGLVYVGNVAYEYKGACPQTVVLKENTIAIADYAFSNCENITEITIPDTVKSIGNYAFLYCNSLIEITIPESVTNIGDYAFGYYYNYDSEAYEKAENLNISGYNGTAAEKYAKENDIEFISLGEKSVLLGDVNGDGKITIADATTIQKHLAKLTELSGEQLINADTNSDGKITITDATRIQKFLAKLIPSLG